MKLKTAIFDLETDGLLPTVSKIHVLGIREFETKRTLVFRNNGVENTIEKGLELLEKADTIVGHNILHYDLPVIEKVARQLNLEGIIRDTLVMSRLIFADEKERDYGRFAAGRIPGNLIGSHSLDAWGWRLNKRKGDYKKEMEAKGLDPWAEWNQDMEDYCIADLDVTEWLWKRVSTIDFSQESILLEHRIHDLMGRQEQNGFPFDVEAAKKLAQEVEEQFNLLAGQAQQHYGSWWAPDKRHVVGPIWDDPNGINAQREYKKPRPEYGEDTSRAIWAEVTIPKRTVNFKDVLRPGLTEGVPYCKIESKEFNPLSRLHLIDRFTTIYKWVPEEFTDTGRPTVNDGVLRSLVDKIPMAYELAEVYFYKKLLGQLQDGKNGWLRLVSEAGKIHHYCNTGGTVSGRASHSKPNLAQIPRVVVGKEVDPQTGMKKSVIIRGRKGDYGWECRSLFKVPEETHLQVGTDLEGIEFRCLANRTARFDNGALIDVLLNGDIHEMNREAAGLPTRDVAKTFIYAYCVPTDTTQALTRTGWKYRHELQVGEEIQAYDVDTRSKVWTPIQSFADYQNAQVYRYRSMMDTEFDFEFTPDHRWVRRAFSIRALGYVQGIYRANQLMDDESIVMDTERFIPWLTVNKLGGRTTNVWCPNTAYETWVMRQGNNVTITGNCYGAGDWKLGHIAAPTENDDFKMKIGADLRRRFEERIPALGRLVREIKHHARKSGFLIGLDGRKLYVRGEHSALNLILQSDGALIAKVWALLFEEELERRGYVHSWDGDFAFLAWVHDELQIAARKEIAHEIAQIAVDMAPKVGEHFRFICPVSATSKVGRNWAETH